MGKLKKQHSTVWNPKQPFFMCSKDQLQMAIKFIDCAKENIEACSVLYKNNINSLAVFHLQQTTEMCIKADMMLSGAYTQKEVFDFSHDILGAVENFKKRMETLFKWGPGSNPEKLFKWIKANPDSVIRADSGLIHKIMNDAYSNNNQFRDGLKSQGLKEDEIKRYWMGFFGINIISIFLQFHESTTRYPDSIKGLTPIDYTDKLGVVQSIPFLIVEIQYLIDFLEGDANRQARLQQSIVSVP